MIRTVTQKLRSKHQASAPERQVQVQVPNQVSKQVQISCIEQRQRVAQLRGRLTEH
jgi:hypothetical protein